VQLDTIKNCLFHPPASQTKIKILARR